MNEHTYSVEVEWSSPEGTADYRSYPREHRLTSAAAASLSCPVTHAPEIVPG